jgi:hypothetical protein
MLSSIYPKLPVAVGHGVDSVININEYQEYKWLVKGGRHVRLTTLSPSVSPLSGSSKSHNAVGLHCLLRDSFTFSFPQCVCVCRGEYGQWAYVRTGHDPFFPYS